MPNYCTNELRIMGDPVEVDECVERIRSENDDHLIDFSRVIPLPDNPTDKSVKDRWGTSRNCFGGELVDNDPGEVVMLFDTAWSPPKKWLYAVIEMFPNLEFTMLWYELANIFAGEITGTEGDVSEHETSKHETPEGVEMFLSQRGLDVEF